MKMKNNKKNVWYLGLVSFFIDGSSEMIFPILPIFLTTVLKANMAIVGVTVFPANFIGGILWNSINAEAAFIYGVVLAIISAILLIFLIKTKIRRLKWHYGNVRYVDI